MVRERGDVTVYMGKTCTRWKKEKKKRGKGNRIKGGERVDVRCAKVRTIQTSRNEEFSAFCASIPSIRVWAEEPEETTTEVSGGGTQPNFTVCVFGSVLQN